MFHLICLANSVTFFASSRDQDILGDANAQSADIIGMDLKYILSSISAYSNSIIGHEHILTLVKSS
jgi:hypothetical protein